MRRVQCPCCGYYPFESFSRAENSICKICFWQYDSVAHDEPDIVIGPNNVSLNEAKENFIKYGVSEIEFKDGVREPLEIELPENNK